MIPIIDHARLLYEQIYEFYKEAILKGRLKHNQRLPSYRTLAKELGLGNNTVLKAYELLLLEGYVKNENRRGLYVTKIDHKDWQVNSVSSRMKLPDKKAAVKKAPFSTSVHLVDEKNFP